MNFFATFPALLAQISDGTLDTMPRQQISPVAVVIELAIVIVMIASLWKIFTKAGQPGWASIIPIYNAYILCKIAAKPGWWVILLLIPFVNFVIAILLYLGLAKSFGKGGGFAVGLIFLPFIFFPILAWGNAQYLGSAPGGMIPGAPSPYPAV